MPYTIGSGGDFANVDAWWAAMPATLTEDYVGVVLSSGASWNGNLTTSKTFGDYKAVLRSDYSGDVGGAAFPEVVVEGPGAGIRSGAISAGLLEIRRLYLTGAPRVAAPFSSGGPFAVNLYDCYLRVTAATSDTLIEPRPIFGSRIIDNCILEHSHSPGNNGWIISGNNAGSEPFHVRNCLLIHTAASPDFAVIGTNAATRSITSSGIFAINGTWGRAAIFNSGAPGDYNYGDHASVTSNFTGSNNVSGVVLTSEAGAGVRWIVENIAARDYRLKGLAGNVAIDGGSPTNSTTHDMIGAARASLPCAGPFEHGAGPGPARRNMPLLLTPW